MEQTEDAVLVPMDVGWSNIGSLSPLRDINEKNKDGNVAQGDVVVHSSTNFYVRSEGRLAGIIGVGDLVVIDTNDAFVVAHRDVVQDVKNYCLAIKGVPKEGVGVATRSVSP